MKFNNAWRHIFHEILFKIWDFALTKNIVSLMYYACLAILYISQGWKT